LAALPLLDSLRSKTARADDGYPRRLFVFHFGDGSPMHDWTPASEGTGFSPTPILSGLGAQAARVDVLTGLSSHALVNGQGGNPHAVPLLVSTTGALPARDAEGGLTGAGGPSVEQLAGQLLGDQTAFASLAVASAARNDTVLEGRIWWSSANTPVAPIRSATELFDMLFAGFDVSDQTTAAAQRARRLAVLDHVGRSIEAVRGEVSTEDRAKLDEHLDAVHDLERSFEAPIASCEVPPQPPEIVINDGSLVRERAEALLNLSVRALACDRTRVVSFSLCPTAGGLVYDFLGLSDGDHDISHKNYFQDTAARQEYVDMTAWKVSQFARLIELLSSIPEGSGTLLDHTCVIGFSEMSEGNGHHAGCLPVLAAGGGLQGGRHVIYPCQSTPLWNAMLGTGAWCSAAASTPLSRLWLTALRAIGADVSDFGDAGGATLDGLWSPDTQ
jgi:hypothetical protein